MGFKGWSGGGASCSSHLFLKGSYFSLRLLCSAWSTFSARREACALASSKFLCCPTPSQNTRSTIRVTTLTPMTAGTPMVNSSSGISILHRTFSTLVEANVTPSYPASEHSPGAGPLGVCLHGPGAGSLGVCLLGSSWGVPSWPWGRSSWGVSSWPWCTSSWGLVVKRETTKTKQNAFACTFTSQDCARDPTTSLVPRLCPVSAHPLGGKSRGKSKGS